MTALIPCFRVELMMDVRPGYEREFEEAWLEVGNIIATHPDNIAQWFSASQEVPGRFVIISDWLDEEAFRRFQKNPSHIEQHRKISALRTSFSKTTQQVLHYLPGKFTK